MNPAIVASVISVQKVSRHHYLIRGDEKISSYMKFCNFKWSNTYQGWIVHEDQEVDLLRLHIEVLDSMKEKKKTSKQKTKKSKLDKKKKQESDRELYERFKRGEEITDDEDDEYEPSDPSSYEEDSFCVKDSTDEEEEEEKPKKKNQKSKKVVESDDNSNSTTKSKKKCTKKKLEPESEEEEEDTDSDSEDEECETDPNRKKEYQFYKKGILAYGIMTEKQQNKVEAIWNKYLRGWIIRKSFQEKLEKMGWIDVDSPKQSKQPTIIHTPNVVRKCLVKEKTIGLQSNESASTDKEQNAENHSEEKSELKTESVKLKFSPGKKLELSNNDS